MTNGQLFIKENPTVEIKINGSCVWIYFDGVNHYTMPVKWWDKEIDMFDKIRAEISDFEEEVFQRPNTDYSDYAAVRHCLEIIDKYREGEKE